MQRYVVLLFFHLVIFTAAQGAVEMRCASVSVTGAVTISWVNTAGPAGFQSYNIYHSNNVGGPFVLIGSVPVYATQFYTDNLAKIGRAHV